MPQPASPPAPHRAPSTARILSERWAQAVLAHRGNRQWDAAEAALEQAAQAAMGAADASAFFGDLCAHLGDYPRAFAAYDRAVALQPGRAGHWFNRAAVRRFLGQLREAEDDYDRCLALDPRDAQACLNRADLRVQTPQHNHVDAMEALLAQDGLAWQAQVALRYALAKEYEDLTAHARSWDHLAAGAALRRRHLQYDIAKDIRTVDALIDAFADPPSSAGGDPSAEPIFILGMPRTGSTLVDRMVSSHSQVFAAGELIHLGNAVVDAARAQAGAQAQRRELITASAGSDFAALGADYLARTRPQTGKTPHFTDKLPLNYLYCGIIARALPNARIVHVTRHPMATCYGVFKVLFDQGYPFSYDLHEIADYYIGYRRLMAHWRAVLPGRIIQIAYEDLVADPQARCRALIAAVGLAWEPACLAFDRNPAPVATASASQVRRPLYASALAQWRHHEAALQPLRARLEAAGIDCR